ncbi:MAG TPA: CRTAC1 family protein [Terracidiphilus sp.]|nr:CRTAC1 family protein [Terracidiphilus sp.]
MKSSGAAAVTVWRLAGTAVCALVLLQSAGAAAQMGTATPLSAAERAKAAAEARATGPLPGYPQLVDITAETGVHFDHRSSPEAKFIAESMSGGVALIDYDGDGWPDIYFTNAQSVEMAQHGVKARSALFHNNHDGTFTDVTDKAGVGYPCWAMGAAVGDYNNDGRPDLLVTCLNGVVLYRNNGDGTFTNVTRAAGLASDHGWATGATFGDYDGDGWDDLYISHYVDFNLHDLPAFGSKEAKRSCKYLGLDVQCGPRGLKALPDNLYHNNGNGTFADVSKAAGMRDEPSEYGLTALWSDFDNDGRIDLFVANDGEANLLYRNEGNGKFDEEGLTSGVAANADGVEQANMGVAVGDYRHNGRMDLVISHFDIEYAALYDNAGGMNFDDDSIQSGIARGTQGYVGWGDAFVDFSNDGWLDYFLVNGHVYPQVDQAHTATKFLEPKLLFVNQRDGTFKNVSRRVGPALQKPQVSRGVAVGDLFNDGRMEAVVENLMGEPMILRPEDGPPNHWISFQLEGVKCNQLALNARVQATAGDLVQTGEVLSGGSYLSQSDLRIHFGLGNHERVDKALVLWPDGTRETLTNLAADRFYVVREGLGVIASKAAEKPARLH